MDTNDENKLYVALVVRLAYLQSIGNPPCAGQLRYPSTSYRKADLVLRIVVLVAKTCCINEYVSNL